MGITILIDYPDQMIMNKKILANISTKLYHTCNWEKSCHSQFEWMFFEINRLPFSRFKLLVN